MQHAAEEDSSIILIPGGLTHAENLLQNTEYQLFQLAVLHILLNTPDFTLSKVGVQQLLIQ